MSAHNWDVEDQGSILIICHRVLARGKASAARCFLQSQATLLMPGCFPPQIQIPSGYYVQTMNSNRNLDGFLLPVAVMNVVSTLPLLILAPCIEYFSTCLFPSKRDGSFLLACISKYNLASQVNCLQHFKIKKKNHSAKI